MKRIYALFIIVFLFSSCGNNSDFPVTESKDYQKSSETIEKTEQKHPENFLTVEGKKKKNMLGQTVIRGTIINKAKMVTFKDVEIKLFFYSKTGTLLEEDVETIYEEVHPGSSVRFKSKYFAPKGSDKLELKVMGAKY